MTDQTPPSPASPAQERCNNPGCLHTVADGCPAQPAPSEAAGTPPVGEPALDVVQWLNDTGDVWANEGQNPDQLYAAADELSRLRAQVTALEQERDEALLPMKGRCDVGHRPSLQYDLSELGGDKGCVACDRDAAEARAEQAEATLAQARAEFWREAAQVAREWALGGDNPLDDVNVVLRQLADQMDQRATPTPAPPQE